MTSSPRDLRALRDELVRTAHQLGLSPVGVTHARPFDDVRDVLEARKLAGLHADMQFTYRQPARSTDPSRALPGARSLVVAAADYLCAAPEVPPRPSGRVAKYSWSDRYRPLRSALEAVASVLVDAGFRARVLVDDNALVDRPAAVRAGLGTWGKNGNVLIEGRGSWFLLGSVVTDADLPATPQHVPRDPCGTCTRCISACPTEAIVAPGVVDARRCLAWLVQASGTFPTAYREALGDRLYGCDDCQEVCPPNLVRIRRRRAPNPRPGDEPWVELVSLLSSTDEDLLERHGRWYLANRDPALLRRNALVVLGNVGSGNDPEVEATLVKALADPRPVIRSHAVWAAARLGRTDLLDEVRRDQDHDVQRELSAAGIGEGS